MKSLAINVFTLAVALVGASGVATSQSPCYEPNIGTSVGIGDDIVLGIQPIGFAFPFGSGTYTDIHPCTNGFVYLSNAGTPAPGGANCCSGTTALLVAGSPKICPMFNDLNMLAANSAGVYVNNTIPGKCVVTWLNAVEFGNTVTQTLQMQMFASGAVLFTYDSNVQIRTAGDALVGLSPAAGASVPPGSDLSAGGAAAVPTIFEIFNTTLQFDLPNSSILFSPSGAGYSWSLNACTPSGAQHTSYGSGCYRRAGSFYELFPGSTFDLSGTTITLTPSGNGYVVLSAPLTNFFTPVAAALAMGDDTLLTGNALPSAFPYPGGSSSSLDIHSNGQVFPNGGGVADYTPTVAELLSRGLSYGAWMDFNVGAGGSIHLDIDLAANIAYITWNGAFAFGTTSPNTWQIAMFLVGSSSPGQVELRFQSVQNNATLDANCLTGYTPGNGALDPGSIDLSTALPVLAGLDVQALTLLASPAPALGATVTYTLSNIPANVTVSAHLMSFGQIPAPGVNLVILGAQDCFQLINLSGSSTALLFGSPTATRNITIPNSPIYAGLTFYNQGASLVSGVNPFGLLTSNGVSSLIN